MEASAFSPAHVTGFFKAHMDDSIPLTGSMGAGFSIRDGVTTRVRVSEGTGCTITTSGYDTDKTDVSEAVASEFLRIAGPARLEIHHEIGVPVGYGLGSSGAVALSLALALDSAMRTDLGREGAGVIAHMAEVRCKTGLGDVLASLHGGFEVRTMPGAPGTGRVESIPADASIIMACISPVSTSRFITESLSRINGLGGKMVGRLLESRSYEHFQEMSMEFARYANVMTPRMERLAEDLGRAGARCGVALFGETIFSMVRRGGERSVLDVLEGRPCITVRSGIDCAGARIV